jgi:hypothetical protein
MIQNKFSFEYDAAENCANFQNKRSELLNSEMSQISLPSLG